MLPIRTSLKFVLESPNGQLFTYQGILGWMQTVPWSRTTTFYFYQQDVTGGNERTAEYTLATLTVNLQTTSTNGFLPPRFETGRPGGQPESSFS